MTFNCQKRTKLVNLGGRKYKITNIELNNDIDEPELPGEVDIVYI